MTFGALFACLEHLLGSLYKRDNFCDFEVKFDSFSRFLSLLHKHIYIDHQSRPEFHPHSQKQHDN